MRCSAKAREKTEGVSRISRYSLIVPRCPKCEGACTAAQGIAPRTRTRASGPTKKRQGNWLIEITREKRGQGATRSDSQQGCARARARASSRLPRGAAHVPYHEHAERVFAEHVPELQAEGLDAARVLVAVGQRRAQVRLLVDAQVHALQHVRIQLEAHRLQGKLTRRTRG